MKWQSKPDKEGYYLMRSGDTSAWSASSCVKVYNSQSYLSMTVLFVGTNIETCVDDYSDYVDWLFLGTEEYSANMFMEEEYGEEAYELIMLPKVNKKLRDETTEGK